MVLSRGFQSLRGKWIDCPSEHKDQIYPVPDIPAQDQDKDYLEWPLPPMKWRLRLKMFMDQLRILKI